MSRFLQRKLKIEITKVFKKPKFLKEMQLNLGYGLIPLVMNNPGLLLCWCTGVGKIPINWMSWLLCLLHGKSVFYVFISKANLQKLPKVTPA